MTYRIRESTHAGATVFALSGVLDIEHAARLQELLATASGDRIVLDLNDVTLVDRDAVRFLARVETASTKIVNCPEYVRRWIAVEHGAAG